MFVKVGPGVWSSMSYSNMTRVGEYRLDSSKNGHWVTCLILNTISYRMERSTMPSPCSRTQVATSTWAMCESTPYLTQWLGTIDCAGRMYYILWAGMPLGCRQKMQLLSEEKGLTNGHTGRDQHQGPVSIWRPSFPGMGIPMLKIRRSPDHLIFNMGIPILVRRWFLTLGLFGRRVIVVACVCPSVRLSVCLFPSSLLTQLLNQFIQ